MSSATRSLGRSTICGGNESHPVEHVTSILSSDDALGEGNVYSDPLSPQRRPCYRIYFTSGAEHTSGTAPTTAKQLYRSRLDMPHVSPWSIFQWRRFLTLFRDRYWNRNGGGPGSSITRKSIDLHFSPLSRHRYRTLCLAAPIPCQGGVLRTGF
jgi:hypothetical protein